MARLSPQHALPLLALPLLLISPHGACDTGAGTGDSSLHIGAFHPSGADIVGYSSEQQIGEHWFRYYAFGFPALAAIGINYYEHYSDNGLTASFGTGLGYFNQANLSISYQWKLQRHGANAYFVKIGLGYEESLVANGVFPVLSLEQRWH